MYITGGVVAVVAVVAVVECLPDPLPIRRVATIAKGISTTTPMFSPRPKDSIPTDGPARGATEGQPHAPDSMRPDAVVARSHCSPLSTRSGQGLEALALGRVQMECGEGVEVVR